MTENSPGGWTFRSPARIGWERVTFSSKTSQQFCSVLGGSLAVLGSIFQPAINRLPSIGFTLLAARSSTKQGIAFRALVLGSREAPFRAARARPLTLAQRI